jgi:hypothetical protein
MAQERALRDACARGEREHAALVAAQRQMANFERDAESRQARTRALIRANRATLEALGADAPALDAAWRALREEGELTRAPGGSRALRSLAQRRKGSTADELDSFRTTPLEHSGSCSSPSRQIAREGHAGLRWTLPRVGWAWWRAADELPALLRANGAKARALARKDARLPAELAVAAAEERKALAAGAALGLSAEVGRAAEEQTRRFAQCYRDASDASDALGAAFGALRDTLPAALAEWREQPAQRCAVHLEAQHARRNMRPQADL